MAIKNGEDPLDAIARWSNNAEDRGIVELQRFRVQMAAADSLKDKTGRNVGGLRDIRDKQSELREAKEAQSYARQTIKGITTAKNEDDVTIKFIRANSGMMSKQVYDAEEEFFRSIGRAKAFTRNEVAAVLAGESIKTSRGTVARSRLNPEQQKAFDRLKEAKESAQSAMMERTFNFRDFKKTQPDLESIKSRAVSLLRNEPTVTPPQPAAAPKAAAKPSNRKPITPDQIRNVDDRIKYNQQEAAAARARGDATAARQWDAETRKSQRAKLKSEQQRVNSSQTQLFSTVEQDATLPLFNQ